MTKIRWEETNKVDPMEEEKWEKLVEEVKALVKELAERYAEEDVPLFLRIPKRLTRLSKAGRKLLKKKVKKLEFVDPPLGRIQILCPL